MSSLCAILAAAGAVLNHPASESDIDFHQRRLGVIFPKSLSRFYMQSDGVNEPFGEFYWNWWPVCKLITAYELLIREGIHDELPDYLGEQSLKRSVVFCDALYCLPAYAILLDGRSALNGTVYALNPYSYSTPSFEGFVESFAKQYPSSSIGRSNPL